MPLPAPVADVIEIDEICLRQSPPLWIALSRQTQQVLGFALGDRSDAMLPSVWSDVPQDYQNKAIVTDGWSAYARFFTPEQNQVVDKGSSQTSQAEGHNTKWRQRQSGLVRRSCGVHWGIAQDIEERFLILTDQHNTEKDKKVKSVARRVQREAAATQ